MQIPNLPTDNLYKFQALAGLTILIAATWFLIETTTSLAFQIPQLQSEVRILEIQTDHWRSEIDKLGKQESKSKTDAKEIEDEQLNLKIKLEELRCKAQIGFYGCIRVLILSIVNIFFLGWAARMTNQGFRNWQNRIQKYQDIIVKTEARNLLNKKSL
jgi:hypothetical protein